MVDAEVMQLLQDGPRLAGVVVPHALRKVMLGAGYVKIIEVVGTLILYA